LSQVKVSALIGTRNRGALVGRAVSSILASPRTNIEVIVVDQSDEQTSYDALVPHLTDARFRYETCPPGHSTALNHGLRAARGEIVAITDDDCEVPSNWLDDLESVFLEFPCVVVAFCTVSAGPHDRRLGFVPTSSFGRGTHRLRSLPLFRSYCGLGAGMAVRRIPTLEMGGFDELLGPGGRFPSAGDRDIAIRALLLGHEVCLTDRTSVVHNGFRTWREGKSLAERDWVGIGAAYAKPLIVKEWRFLIRIAAELIMQIALQPVENIRRGRPPGGLTRLSAFTRGFLAGIRAKVDDSSLNFQGRGAASFDSSDVNK
jgi:glycosyltransferase involved in cell wall biosynthesis